MGAIRKFFGEEPNRNLPSRVVARIQAQREAGEILVGWVQLAVVIIFCVLYLVSPKTFSREVMIEPVPWALAGYLLFTLLRIVLAHRRSLGFGVRIASVVIDIVLLLILIWSFHIQYEQPATFVLKSPTLLYVFIFIAMRTLLLEPGYVVVTGITATVGWLLLVWYAIATDATGDPITRDYVHYLTSNSVLIGAEVDKVLSILVVTVLLAVAMWRGRSLLVAAVIEGARAQDLARFFAPEIARSITDSENEIVAGHGELREAAILFVDIRGFTDMAAHMPPDSLIALLGDYQARLVPAVQDNGGTTEKFLGDGMMASFGAALATETYAADALRAADGVLDAIDAWNKDRAAEGEPPIRVGVAVTVGRIVFGAVGGEQRLEIAVVGQPVNLGAKLEKHTKVEKVRALCTAEAFDCASRQGYRRAKPIERRPARIVDGVPEPMDLVILDPQTP